MRNVLISLIITLHFYWPTYAIVYAFQVQSYGYLVFIAYYVLAYLVMGYAYLESEMRQPGPMDYPPEVLRYELDRLRHIFVVRDSYVASEEAMDKMTETKEDFTCPICTESNVEKPETAVKTECNHVFHKACLGRWRIRKPTCPICIRPI